MVYNSVKDIFETVENTRTRIYERVGGLSQAQGEFRPAADAWSVADLMEHISLTEASLVRRMTQLLAEAEAAGAQRGAVVGMRPFSLDHLAQRAGNEKFEAPERVRPHGLSISEALAKLRSSREELRALRPRIEALDLSEARFPHPAFGPLNIYEWLAFIGLHEDRHLSQAESVMSSRGFPS